MNKLDETNNAINDPEFLSDICAHVSVGGTLVNFCGERTLDYKLVNRWIEDDEGRARRYKLALDVRESHAKDLIIAELIAYLKADVTKAFDPEGNMLRVADMPHEVRRLIAGIKFREIFEREKQADGAVANVHIGNIIEVKFWDKPRSIETFMKHLAMLIDRKDVKLSASLADLVAGSMKQESTGS